MRKNQKVLAKNSKKGIIKIVDFKKLMGGELNGFNEMSRMW